MKKILFFTIVCWSILSSPTFAQITNVTVSIAAMPPYSPYLTDYLIYENRTAITVTAIGTPGTTADVYFKGSIIGDNGVSIKTKQNFYPTNYISLTANLPKRLTGNDLKDFFDWNYVDITGVSIPRVIRNNGVPEGNYTLCFQAFDYHTKQPLMIAEMCSAPLMIQHVNPPTLTSPICESEINKTTPQTILFSWTYNPGVSRSTRYLLKMVELLDNQNPNDAINSQSTPAFFEKTISSVNYLYSAIDPVLTVGKKYAWRVKAFDLDNKIKFKNNGESEVCTFIYKANLILSPSPVILTNTSNTADSHAPAASPNNTFGNDKLKIMNPVNNGVLNYSNAENFLVNWLTQSQYDYFNQPKFGYQNQIIDKNKKAKQDNDMLHQTDGWKFSIKFIALSDYYKNGQSFEKCTPVWSLDTITREHFQLTVNEGEKVKLKSAEKYVVKIYAADNQHKKLVSDEVQFTFKNTWQKPIKQIANLHFMAKVYYKFLGGADELPMYSTPYGIYDVWYLEDATGAQYRLPSNKFNSPVDAILTGTITNATAYFDIPKNKLDTTKGYGMINPNYSTMVYGNGLGYMATGKLFHALYLLPYSPYYPLTANYIFPVFKKDISIDESYNCGKLIYQLYDYDVTIKLHKKYFVDGKQIVDDNSKYLLNKMVYVLRKSYPTLTPTFDGDGSGNHANIALGGVNYWIIDKHNSTLAKDKNGNDVVQVEMKNLICNWLPDDEYFIYVDGEPLSCITKGKFAPAAPVNIFNFHYHRDFDYYLVSENPPPSVVKGRILYKYADDGETEKYPLGYKNLSIRTYFILKLNEGGGKEILCRTKQELMNKIFTYSYDLAPILQGLEEVSKVCGTTTTSPDGSFSINIPYDFIVGSTINLATGGGGEFKFTGGSIKHILRLVVDDKYFCSPDENIELQPFQTTNVGDLTSLVKSYSLVVRAYSTSKDLNTTASDNGKLKDVKIKVIRYNPSLAYDNFNVPNNEGMQYSDPNPDNNLGKTVSMNYTDENGKAIFKRMVRHMSYSPYDYYYINGETDNTSIYNYWPATTTDEKKDFAGLTSKLGDKLANDIYSDLFNSEYKYVQYRAFLNMDPKLPIIAGRLVNASSANKGLPDASVMISKNYTGFLKGLSGAEFTTTDENGYFKCESVVPIYNPNSNPANQPAVTTLIFKEGYLNVEDYKSYFVKTEPSVKFGQQINYKDIPFVSNGLLFVKVKDEEGKTVEAFARVGDDIDDKYVNSKTYILSAPSGKNKKLYILPLDPKYYPDTINIAEVKSGWTSYPEDVIIKVRKHRITFKITDAKDGAALQYALVTFVELSNTPSGISDAIGRTPTIEFLNIATHKFNVKIEKWGYTTQYLTIENFEQKAGNTVYYAKLSVGKYCWGHVTLDGVPMEKAIVYVKAGNGMPLISCLTDKSGLYFVTGMPDYSLYGNAQVIVNAGASTGASSKTVVGQFKVIKLKTGQDEYKLDFDLKSVADVDLTTLLGYPIILEKYEPQPNNKAIVGGIINLDDNNSNFKPLLSNDLISFENVEVETKSNYNAKLKKTLYYTSPTVDSFDLSTKKLKIKANNSFNVLLYNHGSKKIRMYKTELTNGSVKALARIVDNSFNVPSSYLQFDDDQFYLYKNENGTKDVRPIFFTHKEYKNVDYHLSVGDNKYNSIHFNYLGFEAKSSNDAYLEDDYIKLPAILSTTLPEGGSIDNIKAGTLTLHSTYFEPVKGNEPLTFQFEKWNVVIKDWMLDNSKGGFSSSNATFKTGVVDVNCNQFILKAHHLPYFDGFNLDNLTLGGLVPLSVNNSATKHIGYDLQTGSDNKAHWKLSVIGNNSTAATVKNIPGTNSSLDILALSLISNGEALVTLPSDAPTLNYSCGVSFKPSTFSMPINSQGIANSFALQGTLKTGIPRTQDNVSATLIFSGNPGNLKMNLAPLNFNFEGKGFVKFVSSPNNQILSNNEFTLDGTVEESGKLSPIKVKLHRQSNSIYIQEDNPSPILFGDKKMTNVKCKMAVEGTDWGLLAFDGLMDGFEGMGKNPEDRHLYFTVYGEIKAENQVIQMNGISTPFGQMQLTFDLPKSRITGVLKMDKIDFGGTKLNGQANMLLDGGGFYISASVQVTTPAIGSFSGGLLVGKYPSYSTLQTTGAITTLLANAYDKNVPCTFQTEGLNGFIVMGKRELKPIPDFHLNLVVVAVSLVSGAGVDARVYMNLAGANTFGIAAVAFADVDLVCTSITCTKVTGHVKAEAKVAAEFSGNEIAVEACGSVKLAIAGEQCLPSLWGTCTSVCIGLGKEMGVAYKLHASNKSGFSQEILWGENCTDTHDCK